MLSKWQDFGECIAQYMTGMKFWQWQQFFQAFKFAMKRLQFDLIKHTKSVNALSVENIYRCMKAYVDTDELLSIGRNVSTMDNLTDTDC